MNKRYLLLTILLFVMLFPITVKGLYGDISTCSNIEKANLRKIASNVSTSFDYIELDNGGIRFNVTLTNLTSNLYVIDTFSGQTYNYNGPELTVSGYYPGDKIKYEIYSSKDGCIDGYLSVKYVNLPNYNKFYKNPLCKGMEQYDVCSKWQLVNISNEEFEKKIKSYQKTEILTPVITTEKSTLDRIVEFYGKYYIFIFGGIILVFTPIIYIHNKKNSFNL